MTILSKNELKNLIEKGKGNCISIYLPTETAGAETRQNPIRFKNLIGEAEEKLIAHGVEHADAVKILEKARKLDRNDFWQHQNEGLAIFIADNFLKYYRLPLDFEELVVVSDRFQIKPLMPLLTGSGKFYILALNQDNVRFLEASRDRVREIPLDNVEEVPESLTKAVYQFEDTENQTQFETVRAASPGAPPGSSPGTLHGRGVDEDKQNKILQFFHQLDAGLRDFFQDETAPLVLVGVDYLLPIYQQANSYPHLLEEGVSREPKLMQPEELQELAWEIVSPYFQQAQEDAINTYREVGGNKPELTADRLEEIAPAAYYQRVDTLFVAIDYQQWGRFDPQNNTVEIHDSEQPGDRDLLDFVATHTLINGGTVYAVPTEDVPADSPVAAIFRFPSGV